jgi:ribonuclease-3
MASDSAGIMLRWFSNAWIDLFRHLSRFFRKSSKPEEFSAFNQSIFLLTGFRPSNPDLYQLATRHSSASSGKEHNERLEFLGDAVLGLIVAEFLFKKFPFREEGFLTEIRSRIVNGEHLAQLARKTGLSSLIAHNQKNKMIQRSSMYGDAMEALVAAVYLDHGFEKCRQFVLKKLIQPHCDIESIIALNINYKSQLIEYAQKKNQKAEFTISGESGPSSNRQFLAEAIVDGKVLGKGRGLSKKKAEQAAAEDALKKLNS